MGLLSGLLLFPVTGPIRGFQFVLEQIKAEADAVLLDERRVQAELMDLMLRHDLGDLSDEEYAAHETALLERLNTIRAYKEDLLAQAADMDMDVDGDES